MALSGRLGVGPGSSSRVAAHHFAALLVCGVLATSCRGAQPASCDAASCDAPSSCLSTADCLTGERCVYGMCATVMSRGCTTDDDCAGICHEGDCVWTRRPNGEPCTRPGSCVSFACEGVARRCADPRCNTEGESCYGANDCCSTLTCRAGVCASGCASLYEVCAEDEDCCSGGDCVRGLCVPRFSRFGQVCDLERELFCQAEPCIDGICGDVERCGRTGRGGTCTTQGDCCPNSTCIDGMCEGCDVLNRGCTTDVDCCPGTGSCVDGLCIGPCRDWRDCGSAACVDGSCVPGCLPEGTGCYAGGWECCGDRECVGGRCGLPMTGMPCGFDRDCPAGDFCGSAGMCGPQVGPGASCPRDAACAGGRMCRFGFCSPRLGEDCTVAGTVCEGSMCGSEGRCCRDAGCMADTDCCTTGDRCADLRCCHPSGALCTTASECCSGSECRAGRCCGALTTSCGTGADCCTGTCAAGACACAALGATCGLAADCCGGASCTGGRCCLPSDAACSTGADCCSGTCRGGGRCA